MCVIQPSAIVSGLAVYADGEGDPFLLVPTPHACRIERAKFVQVAAESLSG